MKTKKLQRDAKPQMHSIHKKTQTTCYVVVLGLFQSGGLAPVWEGWGASVGAHCQSYYNLNMILGSLELQTAFILLYIAKKLHLFHR